MQNQKSVKNRETMARNIRYFMSMCQMKQSELSRSIGVSMSTISDWMHARTYSRIEKIERMAQCFGVEMSELVEDNRYHPDFEMRDREELRTLSSKEYSLLIKYRQLTPYEQDTIDLNVNRLLCSPSRTNWAGMH